MVFSVRVKLFVLILLRVARMTTEEVVIEVVEVETGAEVEVEAAVDNVVEEAVVVLIKVSFPLNNITNNHSAQFN